MLKCFTILTFIIIFIFSVWIAREVLLSMYEPRGFMSEHDKDVSHFFPSWTFEEKSDIVESYRRTLETVTAIDEVIAFSKARIYFDSGKIAGWHFFFALKNIGSFYGMLEVSSSGFATETYVHRHFSETVHPMKNEDTLRQLSEIQWQADEIGFAVSYASVSVGKNEYYGDNGKLLKEYSYE